MKLVILNGSPRPNGNCATLAARIASAAGEVRDTTVFNLNRLAFKGCQACYACKKTHDACVLRDDLAPVLEAVRASDALVIATPVYFGDVSSQTKAFVDRMFSFLVPDYPVNPQKSRLAAGKKLAVVLVQGYPKETAHEDIFPRYEFFMKNYLGFSDCRCLRAVGILQPGDASARPELLEGADELARWLLS